MSRFLTVVAMVFLGLAGCAARTEPRVVAERVFSGANVGVTISTYPGEPSDGLVLRRAWAVAQPGGEPAAVWIRELRDEDWSAWAIAVDPPADARSLLLRVQVDYAGRQFEIHCPFGKESTRLAGDLRPAERWVTKRETIHDRGLLPGTNEEQQKVVRE